MTSKLGPISNLRPVLDSSAQTTLGDVLFSLKTVSFDQCLHFKFFVSVSYLASILRLEI